jgi:hypothetical protein
MSPAANFRKIWTIVSGWGRKSRSSSSDIAKTQNRTEDGTYLAATLNKKLPEIATGPTH